MKITRLPAKVSPEPPSRLFHSDLDVLRHLPLECASDALPVSFSSSRWQLTGLRDWPAHANHHLSWNGITNPVWRLTSKEAALCLMHPGYSLEVRVLVERPSPMRPWGISSQMITYWRRFFLQLETEGHTSLQTVQQHTCDLFLSGLPSSSRDPAVRAIRALARLGPVLTYDRFTDEFTPWGDTKSALKASGRSLPPRTENKTPYIPDRFYGPILAAALALVEDALDRMQDPASAVPPVPSRSGRGGPAAPYDDRLDAYISNLHKSRTAVPSKTSPKTGTHIINLAAVAACIGMRDPRYLKRPDRLRKLTEAAEILGYRANVTTYGGQPTAGLRTIASRTASTPIDPHSGRVLFACYIVVAALSGMRASELAAVERGASRQELHDGGVVRFRVASKVIKNQPPGGRDDTWTVIEPVWQALRVAEAISGERHPLRLTEVFSERFGRFRSWVNTHGLLHGLQPIPEGWDPNPRQFRRTLARELGWRPNGVIAGKVQLKQISVAAAEGYIGSLGESGASFLSEVATQERLRAVDASRQVIEAIERGEPVIGLGVRHLQAAVAALPDAPTGGPQIRKNADAVHALARTEGRNLHFSPFAYCWFRDPNAARCLRFSRNKTAPLIPSCDPTRCPQASVHPEHVGVWATSIEDLRKTAKDPKMPPGEQRRATEQADRDEAFIAALVQEEK